MEDKIGNIYVLMLQELLALHDALHSIYGIGYRSTKYVKCDIFFHLHVINLESYFDVALNQMGYVKVSLSMTMAWSF
jgi:hypothetical protein